MSQQDVLAHIHTLQSELQHLQHLVESPDLTSAGEQVSISLGPVIGKVTATSAIILLEVNREAEVMCHLHASPSGQKVASLAQKMPANKPKAFVFNTLPAATKFVVSFTGIKRRDAATRIGRFATPAKDYSTLQIVAVSCDRSERLLEGQMNLWQKLLANTRKGGIDLMLHLGDQVYLGPGFTNAMIKLRRSNYSQMTALEKEDFHENLRNTLRDIYRFNWNLPHLREVLAEVPHLMIWSDNDIYNDFTFGTVDGVVLTNMDRTLIIFERPPLLLKLGHEVYREYQRQLWDPRYEQHLGKDTDEFHFHQYGELGVLFIDMRGNRITPEGRTLPNNPVVSSNQWTFINRSLSSPNLKNVIIAAEIPFVGDSPEDAEKKSKEPKLEFIKDHWSYNSTELIKVLDTSFAWKSEDPSREVLLLGGDIHVGVDTTIKDTKTGLVVRQLTTTPITNHVCEFFPALTGTIDNRFQYKHIVYNERNYGLVLYDAKKNPRMESLIVGTHRSHVVATVGPVVGDVTSSSAIVMLEVNERAPVTCVLTDKITKKKFLVSQEMPANKPKVFHFKKLDPDRRYLITFEGIKNPEERAGTLTTLPSKISKVDFVAVSCDRPERLKENEENLWNTIGNLIQKPGRKVDVMLHLGDQVYMHQYFTDAMVMLRRHAGLALNATQTAELHEKIRNRLREAYRFNWNLPGTKEVLANAPHLMIWSDNDVYNDFTLGVVEGVVLPPVVLRLAHEVYREYQRQLWDPEYEKHVGKHCDEFHFHKYGDVGVLFIDMRGNRIDTNGDTFPERPLVSEAQWKFIEKSLNTPDLQALLVLSEIPFVGDSPDEAKKKALDPHTEFIVDHWPYNKDELVKLLTHLFDWKAANKGREVVMMGGDIHVGVESAIKDKKSGAVIRHVTTSPLTNHVCKFFPARTGSIDDRFTYEHTAVAENRNYAYVNTLQKADGWSVNYSLVQSSSKTTVTSVANERWEVDRHSESWAQDKSSQLKVLFASDAHKQLIDKTFKKYSSNNKIPGEKLFDAVSEFYNATFPLVRKLIDTPDAYVAEYALHQFDKDNSGSIDDEEFGELISEMFEKALLESFEA